MIASLAAWVAALIGLWLIGLGVFMLVRPARSLDALARMGSTPVIHFGELGLRLVAGVVLAFAAEASRAPALMLAVGGFLVVSAGVLMVLPRRWHASYSLWWSERIPRPAVRVFGVMAVLGGCYLIGLMIGP